MRADFKSGFVSIVGSPNVGKSTLMNNMIGQKVAIVTHRPQTTRNKIMGVLTRKEYQIIFIDTPGIHTPKDKLGQYMVNCAYSAINEVECVLFVCDAIQGIKEKDDAVLKRLSTAKAPVYALINKIDCVSLDAIMQMEERLEKEPWLKGVLRVSALEKRGLEPLETMLKSYMIDGPMYFDEDMITDMPERNICAEFVRESAMRLLDKEIPYAIGVDIDKIATREDSQTIDIMATIYCDRDSQKGIIIGKGGSMLKRIGETSRREMEWMMGSKVFLQLWVKTRPDWRNKLIDMKEFGYE